MSRFFKPTRTASENAKKEVFMALFEEIQGGAKKS